MDMNQHGTMTKDNHAALWHGRFEEGPDAQAVAFETSIHVDERMAFDDIRGSIAHAKMLAHVGLISKEEAEQIVSGLEGIKADLESGKLSVDYSAEDIHSFIEATLTDRIGEAGKKVHTGRSRNDQIALDERLYLRRTIPEIPPGRPPPLRPGSPGRKGRHSTMNHIPPPRGHISPAAAFSGSTSISRAPGASAPKASLRSNRQIVRSSASKDRRKSAGLFPGPRHPRGM